MIDQDINVLRLKGQTLMHSQAQWKKKKENFWKQLKQIIAKLNSLCYAESFDYAIFIKCIVSE